MTASSLPHNWALAFFILGVLALCAFMLGASSLLGSKAWGRAKNEPFESGILPTGSARLRFSAKFYLVAMLFVIFDVEALYLFAWAVSVRESGWARSEEHTSELQSRENLVCRLLLEKKNGASNRYTISVMYAGQSRPSARG